MAQISVSYFAGDKERADAVTAALKKAGYDVRAAEGLAAADLLLWSRNAHWVGVHRTKRAPLIARLDDSAPPAGLRAYAAADLRGWRGRPDQPAWRALLRKLEHAPTAQPVAAPKPAPPSSVEPKKKGGGVALALIGVSVVAALAAAAGGYFFLF